MSPRPRIEIYEDFDLLIQREHEGYRVQVLDSPAGSAGPESIPPFNRPELRELSRLARGMRRGGRHFEVVEGHEDPAREFGTRLFEIFFTGSILVRYRESRARTAAEGEGLRVKLRLGEVPELIPLPWEYLYDPEKDEVLALTRRTSLVRYLGVPHGKKPLGVKAPLRVLVLISSPPGVECLDSEREWQELRGALSGLVAQGLVSLERVPKPTLSELAKALRREDWHILHYIGHGEHDEDRGNGALVLEDEAGSPLRVGRRRLGVLFDEPSLRLVVLNACEGARASPADAFSGLAQTLVRKGIPAVVAMQSEISDAAAITFARCFYQHLAAFAPVDFALTAARQEVHDKHLSLEWGAPVLYMHSRDGRIFRPPRPLWPVMVGLLLLLLIALVVWLARMNESGSGPVVPRAACKPPPRTATENPPECPSPPGLDMAFVLIRPGTYQVGETDKPESLRVHDVTISKPFCLGAFEVTRAQYAAVMGGARAAATDICVPQGDVTWREAQSFVSRLTQREAGAVYRLPTEEEWEVAARAGTPTRYYFGDDPAFLSDHGNCLGKDGIDGLAAVGTFYKNPWGLYDVYGNVFEWVDDSAGATAGRRRVRRGGSWSSDAESCSSWKRSSVLGDRNLGDSGLRIVREIR